MSTITVKDGTTIYYKDWGEGPVVTFSHGWPLCADAWDGQLHFLAQNGFRVVAHDRRGHGRSSQAWDGNDMNGYADDLATLIETLDLNVALLRQAIVTARLPRLNRSLAQAAASGFVTNALNCAGPAQVKSAYVTGQRCKGIWNAMVEQRCGLRSSREGGRHQIRFRTTQQGQRSRPRPARLHGQDC